jgi:hypothetical protein
VGAVKSRRKGVDAAVYKSLELFTTGGEEGGFGGGRRMLARGDDY